MTVLFTRHSFQINGVDRLKVNMSQKENWSGYISINKIDFRGKKTPRIKRDIP